MSVSTKSGWANIDWFLVFLYLSLALIGWLMLYAAEYDAASSASIFSLNTSIGRQTIWILISIITFLLIFIVDEKFWNTFAYPIYLTSLILLVVVLIFGTSIKGSTSWIALFGFTFQPSEFAKIGTVLALATYLSYYKTKIRSTKAQLVAASIFAIPAFLILLQPDAGSALVFISLSIMLFRAGLSPGWIILAISVITLFVLSLLMPVRLLWVIILTLASLIIYYQMSVRQIFFAGAIAFSILTVIVFQSFETALLIASGLLFIGLATTYANKFRMRFPALTTFFVLLAIGFSYTSNYVFEKVLEPHQQDRINVWLRPELSDPRGSMYNVLQSKLAISSGGLEGKGYLQGTLTKLNYVPEQSTDFIFSIIGEEQGFIGAVGIIIIFILLLVRITILAERARNNFQTYFAYGVAGFIFFHFMINIGMTMGLLPVIGIPLPFISKGGSAFLSFSIMLSILTKMDSKRLMHS